MKSDQVYKPARQVMFRQNTDGSITIMHLEDFDNFFQLDEWAAELWKQLDGKRDLTEIIGELTERSGLKREFVEQQATEIIAGLLKNKLILLKGSE